MFLDRERKVDRSQFVRNDPEFESRTIVAFPIERSVPGHSGSNPGGAVEPARYSFFWPSTLCGKFFILGAEESLNFALDHCQGASYASVQNRTRGVTSQFDVTDCFSYESLKLGVVAAEFGTVWFQYCSNANGWFRFREYVCT